MYIIEEIYDFNYWLGGLHAELIYFRIFVSKDKDEDF